VKIIDAVMAASRGEVEPVHDVPDIGQAGEPALRIPGSPA
jgi:hypothetical protein